MRYLRNQGKRFVRLQSVRNLHFKKLEIDQYKVVTKFDDNALSQTAPGCVWGIKLGWLSILSNKFDEQV
jgi:hypothetical protein